MFRGLSSWLGLKQPEGPRAREEPPRGDELSAGDAPPEESPEPPAEPTEEVEQQPAEEPELSHQDAGLGKFLCVALDSLCRPGWPGTHRDLLDAACVNAVKTCTTVVG
ncbi:synapse-associated protein 1-like isoform X1 [Meriones unguiculatus]|uniref:synapse-associated protein 1-like isoform X1 n=1 Tax=Meriones unguiculatus TaxID=10047 RepID=UPI00293E02DC|nr:synapse-associated protein 1-like isoform X1 [Meriones unguiculatus]